MPPLLRSQMIRPCCLWLSMRFTMPAECRRPWQRRSRASTTPVKKWTTRGAFKVSLHPRPAPPKLDEGINKVAEKYPSFADLLGTVKQAVLKAPDAKIDYKP